MALAAGVIPLVIHLLNRRQQKRLRFPAVRFVITSQRRVARTYNLRNWLLLAVRTLAVLLLALLLAHPLWETGVGLAARGAPLTAAIIVDNSLSMQAREDGAPFDEAREAAGRILEALDEGDRAAVIATNPVGSVAPGLKTPKEAALKDLGPLAVTAGSADLTGALRTAYRLLRGTGGQKALWVVTDLGVSGWDRLSLPAVGEYDPTVPVKIVTVGPAETPPSATIKALESRTADVAPGLDLELAATVVNFTAGELPGVTARLTIDDMVRDEKQVTLPAGAESTVGFRFKLERPGSHSGYVSLHGDGFAGNRRHYFTIHTRDRLNVLLVDGDPQRALVASETFFLSRALNPSGDLANSVLLPEVILAGALGQVNPEGYQVVVLANVPHMTPGLAKRLVAFVEGGGGLLLALGDRVITQEYNAFLQRVPTLVPNVPLPDYHGLRPLLPGILGDRRRVPLDRNVGVEEIDTSHPALAAFSDKRLLDSLRSARISSYFELVTPNINSEGVLMRLGNGLPLLAERRVGKGRVLVLTTSADSAWNNLPLKTGYVPLVQSLVTYLAGGSRGSLDTGITAGEAKRWSVASIHAGGDLRVVDPRRSEKAVTLTAAGGKASGAFDGNHFAGIYRVVPPSADMDVAGLYAVNPPVLESHIERMGTEELERKLGPVDHEVMAAGALSAGGSRTDLALVLVVLLMATLLFEGWLGQRNYE